MTLDPEDLRSAMRAWTTGVTIVTAKHGDEMHGMTVSSFNSISLNPARISISLQTSTRTHELITQARAFALSILSAEQQGLADLFAGRNAETENRFAGLETEALITLAPLIKGALAWLDCRVVSMFDAGTNTLFIAEVVAARGSGDGVPLVYHDRKYRRLK